MLASRLQPLRPGTPVGSNLFVRLTLGSVLPLRRRPGWRRYTEMIRSILCALFAFSALLVEQGQAQTAALQEKAHPAPAAPDRAEMLAKYQPWCGKPLALPSCVDEIISVDKELLSRAKEFHRTERLYNAGNSLVGCKIYCIVRHFPHDTPDECKASVATFEKAAARKPYLWRTNLRLLLMEKCNIPF